MNRPALQSFREHSVIGVCKGAPSEFPCLQTEIKTEDLPPYEINLANVKKYIYLLTSGFFL